MCCGTPARCGRSRWEGRRAGSPPCRHPVITRVDDRWIGVAADAYRSSLPAQHAALLAIKAIGDEVDAALTDMANALTTFWAEISVALANLVAALFAAAVSAATAVGAPTAAAFALAALGIFAAAAKSTISALTRSPPTPPPVPHNWTRLIIDAAFPAGGWPRSTTDPSTPPVSAAAASDLPRGVLPAGSVTPPNPRPPPSPPAHRAPLPPLAPHSLLLAPARRPGGPSTAPRPAPARPGPAAARGDRGLEAHQRPERGGGQPPQREHLERERDHRQQDREPDPGEQHVRRERHGDAGPATRMATRPATGIETARPLSPATSSPTRWVSRMYAAQQRRGGEREGDRRRVHRRRARAR